jgi:hypothetical protein
MMPFDCWNLLLYWKAIILITGSYIILMPKAGFFLLDTP